MHCEKEKRRPDEELIIRQELGSGGADLASWWGSPLSRVCLAIPALHEAPLGREKYTYPIITNIAYSVFRSHVSSTDYSIMYGKMMGFSEWEE